ncbi:hypothetical protein [Arthrobacter zhaoguopingii]|uniref:hypothetical protein n=1 Tax=Arthrobacter zhaoguopingii TaxID=2681491 RepID=UPI0013595525|nr:hypothetical protein [Arthrobacter zhaoguopingii]
MGFLIFILVIVILMFCAAGWLGFGLFLYGNRTRKKAEANAPAILDAAFAGQDDVIFKINMESPSYETVLIGAKKRGYTLWKETAETADQSVKTLIFQRATTVNPSDAREP